MFYLCFIFKNFSNLSALQLICCDVCLAVNNSTEHLSIMSDKVWGSWFTTSYRTVMLLYSFICACGLSSSFDHTVAIFSLRHETWKSVSHPEHQRKMAAVWIWSNLVFVIDFTLNPFSMHALLAFLVIFFFFHSVSVDLLPGLPDSCCAPDSVLFCDFKYYFNKSPRPVALFCYMYNLS